MKILDKQNFILIAGILFVTFAALDPLHHEIQSNETAQEIECQFCENETIDTDQFDKNISKALFSNLFKIEINQKFISQIPTNLHSRAPPRN